MYRILSQGCLERLELDIGKLIRPVLRGGLDGNAAPLPDAMRLTVLQQTAKGLSETSSDGEETYPLRDGVVREVADDDTNCCGGDRVGLPVARGQ